MNSKTQRLVALWAFAECGVGGLIHALHLPVSGLVVGSMAVSVITLLLDDNRRQWQPLAAALLTVLAVKAALSPHSPPTAYLAVSFQAVAGFVIYRWWGIHRASIVVFAVIALAESAVQRLLVLWLLFDQQWLDAIATYLNWVVQQTGMEGQGLEWITAIYITVHLVTGAWVGIQLYRFRKQYDSNPAAAHHWTDADYFHWQCQLQASYSGANAARKKRSPIYSLCAAIALYVLAGFATPWLAPILRTMAALVLWFGVLMPVGGKLLSRTFRAPERARMAIDTIPLLRAIATDIWKKHTHLSAYGKIKALMKGLFLWALFYDPEKMQRRIYLLTGPVHTGKSTALLQWISRQTLSIGGFVTPEINEQKQMYFIAEGTYAPFEISPENGQFSGLTTIGRYTFLQSAFDNANRLLQTPVSDNIALIVVDEIGKLELRGEGLDKGIRALLSQHSGMILFVVRDSLLEEAMQHYTLKEAGILRADDLKARS